MKAISVFSEIQEAEPFLSSKIVPKKTALAYRQAGAEHQAQLNFPVISQCHLNVLPQILAPPSRPAL